MCKAHHCHASAGLHDAAVTIALVVVILFVIDEAGLVAVVAFGSSLATLVAAAVLSAASTQTHVSQSMLEHGCVMSHTSGSVRAMSACAVLACNNTECAGYTTRIRKSSTALLTRCATLHAACDRQDETTRQHRYDTHGKATPVQ